MQGDLTDKTIIITGAASGIGRAWAQGFVAMGARVVAADIDCVGLAELSGVLACETDVADAGAVRALVEFALDRTGRVDVVFNNAGVGFHRRLTDLREDEFEKHVAIHLFGAVHGMRFALPVMQRQGYGRIINTISRAAEFASPKNSAYAAAKAAIWAATRSTAAENSQADILINMLIPGPTNTGIWKRDMPKLQAPDRTFPTARMLATLPAGGPNARVFWDEKEYPLFSSDNLRPNIES